MVASPSLIAAIVLCEAKAIVAPALNGSLGLSGPTPVCTRWHWLTVNRNFVMYSTYQPKLGVERA